MTPCTFPGCPSVVAIPGRCPAHAYPPRHDRERLKLLGQRTDANRPSSTKRGYGKQWQAIRKRKLSAYPWCEWPGCHEKATQVDHVIPLSAGGTNDMGNLQSLCISHHTRKTNVYDGGLGNKRKEPTNGRYRNRCVRRDV